MLCLEHSCEAVVIPLFVLHGYYRSYTRLLPFFVLHCYYRSLFYTVITGHMMLHDIFTSSYHHYFVHQQYLYNIPLPSDKFFFPRWISLTSATSKMASSRIHASASTGSSWIVAPILPGNGAEMVQVTLIFI